MQSTYKVVFLSFFDVFLGGSVLGAPSFPFLPPFLPPLEILGAAFTEASSAPVLEPFFFLLIVLFLFCFRFGTSLFFFFFLLRFLTFRIRICGVCIHFVTPRCLQSFLDKTSFRFADAAQFLPPYGQSTTGMLSYQMLHWIPNTNLLQVLAMDVASNSHEALTGERTFEAFLIAPKTQ